MKRKFYAQATEQLRTESLTKEYPTPFTVFLDMVGWSEAYFGKKFVEELPKMDTSELLLLGSALTEYARNPKNIWGHLSYVMLTGSHIGQAELSFDNPSN